MARSSVNLKESDISGPKPAYHKKELLDMHEIVWGDEEELRPYDGMASDEMPYDADEVVEEPDYGGNVVSFTEHLLKSGNRNTSDTKEDRTAYGGVVRWNGLGKESANSGTDKKTIAFESIAEGEDRELVSYAGGETSDKWYNEKGASGGGSSRENGLYEKAYEDSGHGLEEKASGNPDNGLQEKAYEDYSHGEEKASGNFDYGTQENTSYMLHEEEPRNVYEDLDGGSDPDEEDEYIDDEEWEELQRALSEPAPVKRKIAEPEPSNNKAGVYSIPQYEREKPIYPYIDTIRGEAPPRELFAEKKPVPSVPIEVHEKKDYLADYVLPPADILEPGKKVAMESEMELKTTADKLEHTLKSFGVQVKMLGSIQGPTVTRYEMQPEEGVKVNKILSLADDIQLNLAAMDIRIEAPIPGKAAIGIEIPNKVNETVMLRDLLESEEFQSAKSKLSFAVGKNIGGKTVVFDIAKMPHLLIAGSTGSGKSVCINTIIISILSKARPDEVKMILIDPKVVELSVYNGLPHLLTPVVTEAQKAAGALKWGVAEMEKRYRLFAEIGVRNMKGYNAKVPELNRDGVTQKNGEPYELMPQVVIVVDELADLMMVAKSDVETSICRLTQLARAAGIHLIIATQRPSVDVITGLIKANMPSRIAFAVSSGVDSRTILDSYGAEKLLGKGDMLFYPQGVSRPERVQGAFVSDEDVQKLTDFIREEWGGADSDTVDISSEIEAYDSSTNGKNAEQEPENAPEDDRDQYFEEAGRFIIDKKKASIGQLQRVFKIGFNRAARIMDQLAEAGVVSGEDGTKARQILMSAGEFEAMLNGGYVEADDDDEDDGSGSGIPDLSALYPN
ncbi:MAG: DNA translocase FtsK [Lachnospiraceae bacterium]|nr:DNA translocase FtsK [Lachnospiraceae bacterium]